MANTAGTLKLAYFRAAAGSAPGILEFTYTYSSTAYVQNGTVNISALNLALDINAPVSVQFSVEQASPPSAAYMVVFSPAANPTLANLGTVALFTTTSAQLTAGGSLTFVLRGRVLLTGPGGAGKPTVY